MKFSCIKKYKKAFLMAAMTISCLSIAAVGFAETKAIEFDQLLRSNYRHEMSNEFAEIQANLYNSTVPVNRWGEVTLALESGEDGSVTRYWYVGDLKQVSPGEFNLLVKRMVQSKADVQQRESLHKTDEVNFVLRLFVDDEENFRLVRGRNAASFQEMAQGSYRSNLTYPKMSSEAAMYVLERFLNNSPRHKGLLEGCAIMHLGQKDESVHQFKIVEHHPSHVVTRGEYQVMASGDILEYDVVMDRWSRLTE